MYVQCFDRETQWDAPVIEDLSARKIETPSSPVSQPKQPQQQQQQQRQPIVPKKTKREESPPKQKASFCSGCTDKCQPRFSITIWSSSIWM